MGGPHDGSRHHEAYKGIGSYETQGARLTLAYGARTRLRLGFRATL
jgi:hypothetical protein